MRPPSRGAKPGDGNRARTRSRSTEPETVQPSPRLVKRTRDVLGSTVCVNAGCAGCRAIEPPPRGRVGTRSMWGLLAIALVSGLPALAHAPWRR